MSGFVAIIAHQRSHIISESEIDAFATAYQTLRGAATCHAAQAGSFARVIKLDMPSAAQPGIVTAGASWAAASGVIFHRRSLVEAPLDELDGQFALIRYDAEADELAVATDPFGLHPLFVATRDGISYVSTSVLALASLLHAAPDRLGLQIFLRAGMHFGATTNWQGIERLEPGTFLRFSASGYERGVYWQPHLDESVQRLDFKSAVDHCIEVSSAIYRDHLASKGAIWSDLTGGYDSRLLNLLLERAGVEFQTNTTGDPQHIDVRLAQQVAAAGGWEWTSFALPDDWPERMLPLLPTALGWSDGNLEVIRLSQVLWTHAEKSRRMPLLVGGGGHERFSNRSWLHDPLSATKHGPVDLDRFIHVRWLKSSNSPLFATDATEEIRADIHRRLLARRAPYAELRGSFQLDVLMCYRQMGHYGAYGAAAGPFLAMQVPAFFKNVLNTAISTNPQYRNGHRLARHMIERMNPQVAMINTQGGSPAEAMRLNNLHRFVPYYATLGRKAAMHLSRKYLRRGLLAPAPVFNDRVTAARRALLDELSVGEPFVAANLRSAALYDPQRLDDLLRSAYNPDFTQTDLLGKIVTIELALRATNATLDA